MAEAVADPLPSWRPGAVKEALLAFVAAVSSEGSAAFVPEPERVAVFDNDGTLWPEQPLPFQAAFAFDELKGAVQRQPELASDPMVQAALAGDLGPLMAGGHFEGLLRVVALSHAGIREEAFRPHRSKVAEGRVVETHRIHHTAAGELIDDLVDETDLGGRVGAFSQELGKQLLGGVAIEADEGANEQAEAIAFLCGPLDRLLCADSMGEQKALKFVEIPRCERLVAAQALHGEVIVMGTQELAGAQAELLKLVAAEQGGGIQFKQLTKLIGEIRVQGSWAEVSIRPTKARR
jgi:hypothetical protein